MRDRRRWGTFRLSLLRRRRLVGSMELGDGRWVQGRRRAIAVDEPTRDSVDRTHAGGARGAWPPLLWNSIRMPNTLPGRSNAKRTSDRGGHIGLPGITCTHTRLLRLVMVCLAGGGAANLGACVRYDTNREFYSRDSLVLKPEGRNASGNRGSVAGVREDRE